MGTSAEELDRLLENARWVRALGVELVGASEADDLVQDAWVVALERSEAARNPAAWLGGVVRRLASRRRRGDARRARREQAVARPEPEPAADALVAEAELSRALIRAVTELDEPYRSTVLLRFYRGWTPEEIARSAGVPGATVRTRLARALAKLRERLDREHGGRAAWAFAFAAPGGGAAATTITGGALMTAKTLTGAAALAAGLGWMIWQGGDDREDGSARPEQGVAAADTAAPAGGDRLPPEPARAVEVPARREGLDAASGAAVADVLLYGTVEDTRGGPVELDWLAVERAGVTVLSASRPRGSYSISGLEPGSYALVARARGFLSLREELELTGRHAHERHDVVLEPGLSIPVRILNEEGNLLDRASNAEHPLMDVLVTRAAPRAPVAGLAGNMAAVHGCGRYERAQGHAPVQDLPGGYSGLLRLSVAPPVHVSVVWLDAILATCRVDGPVPELVFTIGKAQLEGHLGGVSLRFVDALTGGPHSEGKAGLDPPSMFSYDGVVLDRQGSAAFVGRAPGLYQLRLFQEGREELSRRVRVPAGRVEDLGEVRVWAAATLRGSVLDAGGQPTAATLYAIPREVLRGPGDLQLGRAEHATGHFELDKVARGPVQVFVRVQDHALLSRTVDASSGLVEGLVLQPEVGVRVVLQVPAESVGLQLTLAGADGLPFETHTVAEGFVSTRLAPGRYQAWLGRAERVDWVEDLVVGHEPLDISIGAGR